MFTLVPISYPRSLSTSSKEFCYLSFALGLTGDFYKFVLMLAYPGSNVTAKQVRDAHNNITQKRVINKSSFDSCFARLSKIRAYKTNGKYINLTKDFLTDPNFLFVAYNQIKSKPGNTTPAVDPATLDGIRETWFINGALKIKHNKYTFKPARRVNIPKPNSTELRPLTIGSPRDKIIQQAIHLLLDQIYETSEKIFLDSSHGSRRNRSPHTAMKEIKQE